MGLKMKKLWPALATSFLSLSAQLFGVDDMQVRNLENRVSALEQRRGANGMINPPARPVVKNGTDLWLQAEALYWHATEDGLAYAIKNHGTRSLDGRVKNIDYKWDWGFRVGAGLNLPHDGWDALLNWTWFRAHETEHKKAEHHEDLFQTVTSDFHNDVSEEFVSKAGGKTSLHTNFLDFELGREFFVSKWLTLRPFMGARGAWINRNFKVEYKNRHHRGFEVNSHMHNRFRGGGLRGGLNTQWGLGSGWSFYGDIGLALIYGNQRIHMHQDKEKSDYRIAHAHNVWTLVRPMTDLGVGIRWDHLFNCDEYRIRFQLGWEQHDLIGFEKDMIFINKRDGGKFLQNGGDLALSGVSFQARLDF